MRRILLLVLVALVVVLVSRPLREKAQPHVQFMIDPIYEWSARNRVAELEKLLEQQKSTGRPIPAPRDFLQFIATEDPTGGGVDPWGNPYYLVSTRTTFQVGCAGRNGEPGDSDDVMSVEGTR
jgi:hypothetical protein